MENALQRHGAPTLSSDHQYLTYADGTPFFWLADTWWFAATKRMSKNALQKLLADRAKKGFTVILLVIGAPPEVDPLGADAENEGGCAFLPNGDINTQYFDYADNVIREIIAAGIVPCIVGSWGHHIDRFGVAAMKNLWAEIITRWGKLPIIFCLTGEVDGFLQLTPSLRLHQLIIRAVRRLHLIPFVEKLPTANTDKALHVRLEKWAEVAVYIKHIDTHHRLLTVHPQSKRLASELYSDPSWLDINTIQSGHTKSNAGFMIEAARRGSKTHPFVNLEPWYEGILGNFGPSDQRYAFWTSVLSGAKGHTYGAHGIWQLANHDNFMNHWGNSDWQEAIRYEGAKQIGLAKQWVMNIPWWKLTPKNQILTPKTETIHPFEPIIAHIHNQYVLVYLPQGRKHTHYTLSNFSIHHTYTVTYISPITMHSQREETFTNQQSYTVQAPLSKDWLVCISRFDEKTGK
ncbi:hypothetical protein A2Z00_00475 [Candidatus Gottesmanbacteria bacterium RBG_13_45_10]|uniref:Apiosidase-like catalytic domain-containing protein n=1 Tax=Candidatus Gottesmanbacteria bacterium RBG_13_45_10 TaxID=1798370 RepID=A0A1F5ZGF6_9BACT|nr:MAG: hypothetical protein A2Z00_00475 [Candidatus Gottesmanbacteria bacterium RBG_13_45_10]